MSTFPPDWRVHKASVVQPYRGDHRHRLRLEAPPGTTVHVRVEFCCEVRLAAEIVAWVQGRQRLGLVTTLEMVEEAVRGGKTKDLIGNVN